MDLSEFNLFILALGAMGLGAIMLVRGGDWTIDGAVYIARKFGLSPLIIGFTIVAFGTSLPELIVSINANLKTLRVLPLVMYWDRILPIFCWFVGRRRLWQPCR